MIGNLLVSSYDVLADARVALARTETLPQSGFGLLPLGYPGWKADVEARVLIARAGAAAVPLLEQARTSSAPWTRVLATEMLDLLGDSAPAARAVISSLATYDLAKMDSAQLGKPAPTFALTDLLGVRYHLAEFHGKKRIVLVFLGQAG